MVLTRLYPGSDIRRMEDTVERLWRAFGGKELGSCAFNGHAVPIDIEQDDENIIIRASLPGVRPEDINVTSEDDVLTIKAETETESEAKDENYLLRERRMGSFHRSLRLPDTIDTARADSQYENGVLTISFPKQEAKKAKRLEIKVKK